MQRQSELLMFDQRKEAKGAVAEPLDEQRLGALRHGGLHESRTLADGGDANPVRLQRLSIGVPGHRHRLGRVVEEIEVSREPRRPEGLVERHTTSDVAVSGGAAPRR